VFVFVITDPLALYLIRLNMSLHDTDALCEIDGVFTTSWLKAKDHSVSSVKLRKLLSCGYAVSTLDWSSERERIQPLHWSFL